MNTQKMILEANRILANVNNVHYLQSYTEAMELFRVYAGENSSFYSILHAFSNADCVYNQESIVECTKSTVSGFIDYAESGLFDGVSIKREAQIDVVSDFLYQANKLLDSEEFHPAASAVIIGAALEEFLRNWIEDSNLTLDSGKHGIINYANLLRKHEIIDKQDIKDITSWSGLRNDAAHGKWDKVSDRQQILIMLQGVNLFMRKYGNIKDS